MNRVSLALANEAKTAIICVARAARACDQYRINPPYAGRLFYLETIGTHFIAEMYGCPGELLNDESFIKLSLEEAVDRSGATLLGEISHHFHPQGVTALGLLAESHISIHTWPEAGYAAADVFTCGTVVEPEVACRYLVRALKAERCSLKRVTRGADEHVATPVSDGEVEEISLPFATTLAEPVQA